MGARQTKAEEEEEEELNALLLERNARLEHGRYVVTELNFQIDRTRLFMQILSPQESRCVHDMIAECRALGGLEIYTLSNVEKWVGSYKQGDMKGRMDFFKRQIEAMNAILKIREETLALRRAINTTLCHELAARTFSALPLGVHRPPG